MRLDGATNGATVGHWQDVQKSPAFKEAVRRDEHDRKRFNELRALYAKRECPLAGCRNFKEEKAKFCAEHEEK
jgi:hypothetical protein